MKKVKKTAAKKKIAEKKRRPGVKTAADKVRATEPRSGRSSVLPAQHSDSRQMKKLSDKEIMAAPMIKPSVPSMLAVVFDTETTGLVENRTLPLDRQPEVIEFYGAAVDLADGKVKAEVDFLICPSRLPLPPDIIRITGITDKMLEGKPVFRQVSSSVFRLLEKAPLIIAHNLSFDKDMVEIEAQRLGETVAWPRGICTVEQTVHVKQHRLSMSALYQYLFDENFVGAHRAKADVAGLIRIAVELHRREII